MTNNNGGNSRNFHGWFVVLRLMVVERMIAYQGRVWVIVYVFRSYFASVGHWRTNQNNNFFITRRNYYQGAMGELPSRNRKFSSPKHIRENEFARLMLCMWCCAGAKKRSLSLTQLSSLSLASSSRQTWVDVENFVRELFPPNLFLIFSVIREKTG